MHIPPEIVLNIVQQFHICSDRACVCAQRVVPCALNIRAAKALRATAKCFANAYSALYVHVHVGGDFMKTACTVVMYKNAHLSFPYMKHIIERFIAVQTVNRLKKKWFHIHYDRAFDKNPLLVFCAEYMHDYMHTYQAYLKKYTRGRY